MKQRIYQKDETKEELHERYVKKAELIGQRIRSDHLTSACSVCHNFPNWKTSLIVIPDLVEKGFNWIVTSDLGDVNIEYLESWVVGIVPEEDRDKFISLCIEFGNVLWENLNIDNIFSKYQCKPIGEATIAGIKYDISSHAEKYERETGKSIKNELINFLLG